MFYFLFICSLLVPFSMIILGKKWSISPPSDRNGVSGYRTNMSVLNQDTWSFAHNYWGRLNYILGIILIIVSIIVLIYIKERPDFEMLSTYLVFIQIAVMTLTIIPTEIKLHSTFDKKGRRKLI